MDKTTEALLAQGGLGIMVVLLLAAVVALWRDNKFLREKLLETSLKLVEVSERSTSAIGQNTSTMANLTETIRDFTRAK